MKVIFLKETVLNLGQLEPNTLYVYGLTDDYYPMVTLTNDQGVGGVTINQEHHAEEFLKMIPAADSTVNVKTDEQLTTIIGSKLKKLTADDLIRLRKAGMI